MCWGLPGFLVDQKSGLKHIAVATGQYKLGAKLSSPANTGVVSGKFDGWPGVNIKKSFKVAN